LLGLALSLAAAHAGASETDGAIARDRGWSIHVDNDLFAFAERDRDYTAGVSFTLGGIDARTHALSLSSTLDWLNARTRFGKRGGRAEADALEFGLLMFTPQDLAAAHALPDDRPYANLMYVASSTLKEAEGEGRAFQSSLTLGVLGLPFAERLHRTVHGMFGSAEPNGYAHQIADGGEPTLRYAVSRYRLLASGTVRDAPYSLRLGTSASIGYITEAGAEIAFRAGRAQVPWWHSTQASSDYAGHPPVRSRSRGLPQGGGRFPVVFEAGAKARVRLHNSFLEGQFRDSDVTFASSDLNHVLLEAWLGVTAALPNDMSVSYTLRHQTEEIETGRGARGFSWASIGFAQRF
jgi:hypothetical protein